MKIAINRHSDDKDKRQCTAADIILGAYNSNLAGSWRAENSFNGDCHYVVNALLGLLDQVGQRNGWTVVQADIPGGQGWHSWLEFEGWVVDFASGTYAISDVDLYWEMKKPREVRYLTPDEFQENWSTEAGRRWLSNPPSSPSLTIKQS